MRRKALRSNRESHDFPHSEGISASQPTFDKMEKTMLYIFWEFLAKPEKIAEFEQRYGSHGDWAQLFRRSPHFKGTVLGRDLNVPDHYLVTDTWDDAASFAAFKIDFREPYEQLDLICEELTLEEKHIGNFEVI
jgi:hypothetical protein